MSDPPASYYESGQSSLIRPEPPVPPVPPVPPAAAPPKRREPTPPKQRSNPDDSNRNQSSHRSTRQQFAEPHRLETTATATTTMTTTSESSSPKSPKTTSSSSSSKPRSIDKPLKSHRKVEVVQETSGPAFKQQCSGGSILKVEGKKIPPSEATMQATEDARRQQASDRLNSASLSRLSNPDSEPHSSSVTQKQDNKHQSDFDQHEVSVPSSTTNRLGQPLPQQKPVLQNQLKSTSDIWEFDTPNAKSSCCTII